LPTTWTGTPRLEFSEEKSRNSERESEFCKINAELHKEIQRRGVYAEALEGVILWALGEKGEFLPHKLGMAPYYWRPEMRRRFEAAKNPIPTGTSRECPECKGVGSVMVMLEGRSAPRPRNCPTCKATGCVDEIGDASLREQVDRLRLCAREVTPEADGVTYGLAGLCMEAARVIERLASLQRGGKSELAHALRVLHGSKKPHAIPGGTGQQLGNESYRIIASGSQLEALMDAADALERHRTYTQSGEAK
jgi:hypothetical protein